MRTLTLPNEVLSAPEPISASRTRPRTGTPHQSGVCPVCDGPLIPVITARGPGWRCRCTHPETFTPTPTINFAEADEPERQLGRRPGHQWGHHEPTVEMAAEVLRVLQRAGRPCRISELAEAFMADRRPVRSALRQLVADGKVCRVGKLWAVSAVESEVA